MLTDFYGNTIEHMAIGYHDYEDELKKRDYADNIIADAVQCEKLKASGAEEKKKSYSDDLETLIGSTSHHNEAAKAKDDKADKAKP